MVILVRLEQEMQELKMTTVEMMKTPEKKFMEMNLAGKRETTRETLMEILVQEVK